MKHTDSILVAVRENDLAVTLAAHYGKNLITPRITTFADGEKELLFEDTTLFAGKKVVIVHPTCPPVAEEIILITLLSNIIRSAGCKDLVALVPYLGYSRHTKMIMPQIPPVAEMIVHLLEALPIDRFICVELHDEKDQAFFTKPIEQVTVESVLADYIKAKVTGDYCIVAPDSGAYERAQKVAELLDKPVIAYSKQRVAADTVTLGKVSDFSLHKKAVIIDDIIDTGGTAMQAARDLKDRGIEEVYGCFVHGIFSKKENIPALFKQFNKIFVSNSVPVSLQDTIELEIFDISKSLIPYLK
ncbi:MAG: ribose-phosphate diphosphokinase [Candidatus Dependentiae bacterium]|nr:ribose-phosphate diphosphokinase [Candidatus Dependentiae bacterium]